MYNNAIRSAAIKTSNGTYNTRGLGAEAENVVISRDANGNIIEDLAPATVSTTESLATTAKNIEAKLGLPIKYKQATITLDHSQLVYDNNHPAGMYIPTSLPDPKPYVDYYLSTEGITTTNDNVLAVTLNGVTCHYHYSGSEVEDNEYRYVSAVIELLGYDYGGTIRIIFNDKEWIEAFNPLTYSGQGEVSVEIEFSILYTDESPY